MRNRLTLYVLTLIITVGCNQTVKNETKDQVETKTEEFNGPYFVNLNDGEPLKSPVVVQMGIRGMEVEPAGIINEGKGHHHIIIDGSYVEEGQVVPADSTHIHYGKGQTIDTLLLNQGNHTLTLQFANGAHQSYGENWSKTITVIVE